MGIKSSTRSIFHYSIILVAGLPPATCINIHIIARHPCPPSYKLLMIPLGMPCIPFHAHTNPCASILYMICDLKLQEKSDLWGSTFLLIQQSSRIYFQHCVSISTIRAFPWTLSFMSTMCHMASPWSNPGSTISTQSITPHACSSVRLNHDSILI